MAGKLTTAKTVSFIDAVVWILLLGLLIASSLIDNEQISFFMIIFNSILIFFSFVPLRLKQMVGFNKIAEKSDQDWLKDLIWLILGFEIFFGIFLIISPFIKHLDPIIHTFIFFIRGILLILFGYLIFKLKEFGSASTMLAVILILTGICHFSQVIYPGVYGLMVLVSIFEFRLFRKAENMTDAEFLTNK